MGWVTSHRSNNTGIGKTFEDCIGVVENNINKPDLFGYEIKTHRTASTSYVTLFTKSPSYPSTGANAYLKDKFGEYYPNNTIKKLHTSIVANEYNTYIGLYSFKLIHKPEEKRIYIGVFSLNGISLLDNSVYYTYEDIESALNKKLKNLLFVSAQSRYNNENIEEFLFESAEIYTQPSLELFLQLLDNGKIIYDIRMGAYLSGNKYGMPHDHGSGFRIRKNDFTKLYRFVERI